MNMLDHEKFPKRTLFCGDAGFIGYPFWARILERGHEFLVRAGANVYLQVKTSTGRVVREGHEQQVLCWPSDAQRLGQPPLRLRLLHARINKTKVWLLTSVLDRKKLSLKQAIHLYKMRWGIELEFRGLKQTLNRAELRCRNDARLRVELDWALLGMAVAELFHLKEQQSNRATNEKTERPDKRSLAGTMRALRWCMRNVRDNGLGQRNLADRLREAVTDDYQRRSSKNARYRPPNPDKKPLGDPKIRILTAHEQRKMANLEKILAA
jgi:hypothetical protein